jgi:hypothetical protein
MLYTHYERFHYEVVRSCSDSSIFDDYAMLQLEAAVCECTPSKADTAEPCQRF